MALSATSFLTPQFQDYKSYWLKFYLPGGTTPKSMATAATGGALIGKAQVKNKGFLETAGGTVFIPFVDGFYDAYLFPTEVAADANDTSSAVRIADNIKGAFNSELSVDPNTLLASTYGVGSDGGNYTTEMQAMFDAGNEATTYIVDSTSYALNVPLLINNGFKEVIHYPNCVVDWLGAGLLSTTALALFTINLDSNGARTNETILTTTSAEVLLGDNIFPMVSVAGIAVGKVMRINKHICRVVRIDGLNVITDRTLPIPSMALGSEVSVLLKPNIGSVFQGPSLIKFAPDAVTQVYGFGVMAALCYDVTVKRVYGLHNASRLAELFYCADSLLEDVYQYEPTDVPGGGQSYAARISNGNDNRARKIRSYKGRHCVDITFSHRNVVIDCDDYLGVEASFLTHFNGCRYNKFINCNMYECLFGVYLSADNGDFENEWTDSFAFNSRAIYRPVPTSYFRRLKIVTTDTSRDIIVPRGTPGDGNSVLELYDSHLDLASKAINVDSDYVMNMYGGSYKNTRVDGLFRGIASGTPGAPTSTGAAIFNFYNVQFPDISAGQGRSNLNAKLLFKDCTIVHSTQPFGEDCGDQRYVNCDITCSNPSPTYLITVGSGNNCELIDCTLRDIQLPFRYFSTYPATGTVIFGENKLLGTSTLDASNLLGNMNWSTSGYAELALASTNNGSPSNGTLVYIDSDLATDPIKRKRVGGAWVDTVASSFPATFSGVAGDYMMGGVAKGSTEVTFTRDISYGSAPTGISTTGDFYMYDATSGGIAETNMTPLFSSASSEARLVLTFADTGLSAGNIYELRCTAAASITILGV